MKLHRSLLTFVVLFKILVFGLKLSLDILVDTDFEGCPQSKRDNLAEALELDLRDHFVLSLYQPKQLLSIDVVLFPNSVVVKSQDACHAYLLHFGLFGLVLLRFFSPRLLLLEKSSVAGLKFIRVTLLEQVHEVIDDFCLFAFGVERGQFHLPTGVTRWHFAAI